jgi:hypothetical protein
MEIIKTNTSFDFKTINLLAPQPVQGGSFFTKFTVGEDALPFYVQLPKCLTKQAIVTTKRGKYCDLMYEREQHEDFMKWIEHLEITCHEKIDEKKNLWFSGEYSKDDIENMMTPIVRIYKSGKYVLIRIYLNANKHTNETKCLAYNENEVSVDLSLIDTETVIIPLILIDGIRFTSKSFELDMKMIQIMIIDKPVNTEAVCLIKKSTNSLKASVIETTQSTQASAIEATQASVIEASVIEASVIEASVSEAINNIEPNLEKSIIINETVNKKELLDPIKSEPIKSEPIKSEPIKSEPKDIKIKNLYENAELCEVSLDTLCLDKEPIILKKPNEVYYNIYRIAREKARRMKQQAIEFALEANNIKTKYMLVDQDDDSDDEEKTFL